MVSYNTKDWFTFIFRFHKADTFRKLIPIMLAIGLYSGVIGYLEVQYWKLSDTSYIKNITISTDVIVGYPTETEKDFNETVKLIKKIRPEVLNISKFGARPGTLAAKLKPLKSEIVKERSVKLTKVYKNI